MKSLNKFNRAELWNISGNSLNLKIPDARTSNTKFKNQFTLFFHESDILIIFVRFSFSFSRE